ncbi:MAG: hypothetical protein ACPHK8_00535 [Thermoplasmatota archaeon]
MAFRDGLDSSFSLITATTLHTLGAIGVVAALVLSALWLRKRQAGEDAAGLQRATRALVWASLVANLVGGAMRTYLPRHPGLGELGENAWVQVMFLKHLFIFAALGALLYLSYVAIPRADPARRSPAVSFSAFLVVLGVVVASVLGGYAQITPVEGHEDDGGPAAQTPPVRGLQFANATGTLTTTPVAPTTATGTFVMADVVSATALFIGEGLQLELVAPDGTTHGAGTLPVVPGQWQYEVSAQLALGVQWSLSVEMTTGDASTGYLQETVAIAPSQFFEINTQMPGNGTFCWDWTSSADVAFDVHSHFDGEVQYLVEKTASEDRGCFTNDREGGYSLLWANEGASPVSLTYKVWGQFVVDSYFPPRG